MLSLLATMLISLSSSWTTDISEQIASSEHTDHRCGLWQSIVGIGSRFIGGSIIYNITTTELAFRRKKGWSSSDDPSFVRMIPMDIPRHDVWPPSLESQWRKNHVVAASWLYATKKHHIRTTREADNMPFAHGCAVFPMPGTLKSNFHRRRPFWWRIERTTAYIS